MTIDVDLSGLHREVERRTSDLQRTLGYRIDEATEQIDNLRSELQQADYERTELASRVESIASDVEDTGDDIAGLRTDLERLDKRIAWLERHIRANAGATLIDLDTADAATKKLATTAERGRAAAATLLPDHDQWRHQYSIEAHTKSVERWTAARDQALDALRSLASTTRTDPTHTQAASSYLQAREQLKTAIDALEPAAAKARNARTVLNTDQARRARHDTTIAAGKRAEHALTTRLRTRIAEAASSSGLLPVWFTTAFGPMPPSPNPTAWINLAAEVLAYRITYKISDPVIALGLPPAKDTPQRAWYDKLHQRIGR